MMQYRVLQQLMQHMTLYTASCVSYVYNKLCQMTFLSMHMYGTLLNLEVHTPSRLATTLSGSCIFAAVSSHCLLWRKAFHKLAEQAQLAQEVVPSCQMGKFVRLP